MELIPGGQMQQVAPTHINITQHAEFVEELPDHIDPLPIESAEDAYWERMENMFEPETTDMTKALDTKLAEVEDKLIRDVTDERNWIQELAASADANIAEFCNGPRSRSSRRSRCTNRSSSSISRTKSSTAGDTTVCNPTT